MRLRLRNGRLVRVRPVRSADGEAIQAFVRALSTTSRRLRFFGSLRELTPAMLERLTTGGGGRAFVALFNDDGEDHVVAIAEFAGHDEGEKCDVALVVADDWQGLGLGSLLMEMLVDTAREAGFRRAEADVLRGNESMLSLARASGFDVRRSPIDATMLRIVRWLYRHRITTPAATRPLLLENEGCRA